MKLTSDHARHLARRNLSGGLFVQSMGPPLGRLIIRLDRVALPFSHPKL